MPETGDVSRYFEAQPYTIDHQTIEEHGNTTIFEWSGAQDWIEKHRLPRLGKLDAASTLKSLGIPYVYDELMLPTGQVDGLYNDKDLLVRVKPSISKQERLITFGHELGHIFLKKTLNTSFGYGDEVEEFCERFGLEMALPLKELLGVQEVQPEVIAEIAEKYCVEPDSVILQLMRAGKLPNKVFVDTRVEPLDGPDMPGRNDNRPTRKMICLTCCSSRSQRECQPTNIEEIPTLDLTNTDCFGYVGRGRPCLSFKMTWWLDTGERIPYKIPSPLYEDEHDDFWDEPF